MKVASWSVCVCVARATEKLLGRARQLVDVKKEDGFSALHLASLNNHRDVAEILVKEVSRRDGSVRWRTRDPPPPSPLTSSLSSPHRAAARSTSATTATRRRCSWRSRRATPTWCSCWWPRAPTSTWRTKTATRPCTWPCCARSWPASCSAPPRRAPTAAPPRRSSAGWGEPTGVNALIVYSKGGAEKNECPQIRDGLGVDGEEKREGKLYSFNFLHQACRQHGCPHLQATENRINSIHPLIFCDYWQYFTLIMRWSSNATTAVETAELWVLLGQTERKRNEDVNTEWNYIN